MTSINQAVEKQQNKPSSMIDQYRSELSQVMPGHVRADTFVRVAQGVVRRDAKLAEAAQADPTSLMTALMEAARLGLEPGTDQFYLTPRKHKGRAQVLGIPGYQGLIELMYRSGAVSSVVVETVRENDTFRWAPGAMERPEHEADWFAGAEQRGGLRGVYAYAVMSGGATSKVVALGREDIAKARESAQGTDSAYSPWNTNEEAMWLKTAARRLAKWVPTSTEDRRLVATSAERVDAPAVDLDPEPQTDEPVDAEVVDE